jgi:hypothetical protein
VSDSQRTNYSKGDKTESSGGMSGAIGGGAANRDGNSGPTGSARNYPKGKTVRSTDWNPMKCKGSTYGVNGI